MSENPHINDVSILIVTYKGDKILAPCLESIAATCGDRPQIVVVDNSPSEETRGLVARFPNAVYVQSPGNPGFAGGNNRGLPFCTRKYILLLNNDTLVHDAASIDDLAAFLDANPSCGVAQGTMVLPDSGSRLGGCGSFLTPFWVLYAKGAFVPPAPEYEKPYACFSAIGAFMMLRREALAAAGGFLFRTHFWSYYEETEFCHRVWLSGMETWYVPTKPISHVCGATASGFARSEIMARYLRNQYFSLLANVSLPNRLWLVPVFSCIVAGYSLLHLLRGDGMQFAANMKYFRALFRERKRILAARRLAKRIRKVSDFAIFRRTMKLPPPGYFLRSLRANS